MPPASPRFPPPPVGVANLATRWHEVPLGFPRGEAVSRRLTDEGRRTAGQGMQLDEWQMFRVLPFIRDI